MEFDHEADRGILAVGVQVYSEIAGEEEGQRATDVCRAGDGDFVGDRLGFLQFDDQDSTSLVQRLFNKLAERSGERCVFEREVTIDEWGYSCDLGDVVAPDFQGIADEFFNVLRVGGNCMGEAQTLISFADDNFRAGCSGRHPVHDDQEIGLEEPACLSAISDGIGRKKAIELPLLKQRGNRRAIDERDRQLGEFGFDKFRLDGGIGIGQDSADDLISRLRPSPKERKRREQ
ncbi:MAG: hypothetical protein ABSB74_14595 [Tepidisphaeraceae bacterium]